MTYLHDKYELIERRGIGSFGEVFCARDPQSKLCALKFEKRTKQASRLTEEYKIYRKLNDCGKIVGIPEVYEIFQTEKYNILAMELLGDSLETLFIKYKRFDIPTTIKLALDMLTLLEDIHNKNVIHRDIKPNNFLVGGVDNSILYIVDFGLSKKFINHNKHINFNGEHSMIGTARYTSINVHIGIEPSRRDDLESVGYMLIYFLVGKLPWQGIHKKNEEPFKTIGEVKMTIGLGELCKDVPCCIQEYIDYCRKLGFDQKPNYGHMKKIFSSYVERDEIKLKYMWVDGVS